MPSFKWLTQQLHRPEAHFWLLASSNIYATPKGIEKMHKYFKMRTVESTDLMIFDNVGKTDMDDDGGPRCVALHLDNFGDRIHSQNIDGRMYL